MPTTANNYILDNSRCLHRDDYIGKCYWIEKRARVSSMFSYDSAYLKNHENRNIDPALSLVEGAQALATLLANAEDFE